MVKQAILQCSWAKLKANFQASTVQKNERLVWGSLLYGETFRHVGWANFSLASLLTMLIKEVISDQSGETYLFAIRCFETD